MVYFSSIVLLVIVIMGIYLYNYYYNTIYSDFTASGREYLASVADTHENELAYINNVVVQFGISDVSLPFRLEENSVRSLNLKKQIRNYLVVSQFYSELFLLFDIDDYLYNESTSVHIDRFLDEVLVLGNAGSAELATLLRAPGEVSALPEQGLVSTISMPESGVVYLFPIKPTNRGTMVFVVRSGYYDVLLTSHEEEMRATYILLDGQMVAKRGAEYIPDTALLEFVQGMQGPSAELRQAGGRYLVTVQEGASGFAYCTVQSMEVFQQKFSGGQWSLLLFILLLTIPSTILIFILSKRLHRPVGAIRTLLRPEADGDDFAIIQSGIQRLVEHNAELTELVEENASLRRSQMIRSFVRGSYPGRQAAVEAGLAVGLEIDKQYYVVALAGSSQGLDDKPALDVLLKMFGPDERVTGYGTDLMSSNQSLLVLFSDEKQDIEDFILRLNDTGKSHCESFVLAVSYFHEYFDNISLTYLEANTAYDSRFLMGDGEVLRFEDVASGANDEPLPGMYIDALKNALRSGDEPGVDRTINEIFRHLRSTRQSLFTFRVLYNQIINVLIREWNPESLDTQRIYDIFALSRCLSIQDLDNMLRDTCRMLLEGKKGSADEPDNKMHGAAAYMRENYSDGNLNMNALAEHLNISAVNLSVEFKEAMGMSPSDYLTLLRIERAKQLLLETDLSVKEISAAVGYYDVPGFIRRFKKYTAQTPAQYRQERA